MSWNEYKKKREQESSWAKYKQQRDYERQQKEQAQIEQNKLLEKINLPINEIKNNPTVIAPNANSKNNHITNVRNSSATSLSQQLAQATTTKDKGIVTSVSDMMNKIKADEKNKNIAKGGVDAFNEYMDSTLNAIPGGVMSVVSGIVDAGTTLTGAGVKGLQNLTNNENIEQRLQETYDTIINIGKNINQTGNSSNLVNRYVDNNFTRESSNIVHTISSQLATYGLSLATGLPAPLIQGTYVGGSSAQEVLNENKDDIGRAVLTGVGKGLTSYGVEKLTGGNILGKGSFDDMAVGFIAENFKSKAGQKIASKIYEVGGEVFEENLENAIDMVIDNVVNQKGYTVKDWWNELGETSKGTILSTIALNLLGLGGNTYNDVQQYKLDSQAKKMIKEAESLIEKENLKIDFDKIKQNNKNTDTNLPPQSTQNEQNTPSQQVVPSQQENVQKTNMKTNKILPMQNYVYEKSDNAKVDKFRKSASQNFDNSIESRNYLNMLEKIITDKDVDIIFDANLKDSQGRIANGSYSNGTITINPNSNRTGEFIAIHELTHAIGTNQMRNIVEQYRKSNTAFNSAVENLLKNYNTTELTEEAMADVSAQLFGNQEFINNLAQTEPSLFRKIYNEIKYLWHQFTGYSNQNQFIEDLQYKWEQAYRNNQVNIDNSTKYSFAGERAKNANIDNLSKAKQLEQLGKTPQEIYEETGWYRGNENKWRFEIDDSNFNIKDIKIDKNEIYDLGDILDAPGLYEAYPNLKKTPVYFEDEETINGRYTKADGWYDQIYLNSDLISETDSKSYEMLGLKNQDKLYSTLMHEIQHYIQDKEGFSKGANVEFWDNKKNNLKRNIEALDNDAQHYKEKYIQDFQKGLEEGKYQISDFPKYYEDVIIKDENVKRTQDILEKRENEYNVIKEKTSTNLYNNTAGEQEARNVQDRIKLPTNEKKKTLPFIKNENTVYADKSNESHEVVYKENGSFDRVKIKENIFENNNGKSITRTIKDYLVEHIGEYADIIESGQRVYLGEELPGEYAHSKSTQSLSTAQKLAKGRVLPGIKEIINNATNRQYEANRKTKHNIDAKYGFYRYDTKFSFDYNGKEQIYAGTILIRNDANGKKYLYDITNIKKIGSNLLPVASNSEKSSAIIGSSNSLPTNSIPPSNENVNTTKYPMQESEKNTDNQGRTLSKEQQEYFKDSKVRDENGNLKTMYHGTDAEFNEFTYENYGKTGTAYGKGFYFTDSKEAGQAYGKNLKEVYLDIKKPMEIGKTTMSKTEFKKLIEVINKQTDGIIEADYGSIEDAVMEYDYGGDDIDLTNSLMTVSGLNADRFYEILRSTLGYDGIKANNNSNGKDGNYYLAFNSNQIKNVDNTSPTTNPDIRYSLPTKEWQEYLDENYKPTGTRTNLEDIKLPVKQNNKFPVNQEAEIANILQKPQEKVKEKDRSWAIIKANLIDKGMVFEELSRKTGNRELQGKWDATLTATARGQNAIGNARYELDPKTKNQKQISKSLTDIIAEVGENTADFYAYMYHQLNIDRMTLEERFGGDTGINYERKTPIMNKPVFGESVTAKMSIQKVAELEKKYPEFKEYAQDVYDYLDTNTKELVDNGVISKETQQLFKDMYPHYVPISRVRNKGQAINVPLDTGRTGINSPIKKATGGSSDINPLFETMADRTLQTYRASARNSFGVELKNTINQTNQVSEQADIDTIIENMTDEEQNKQLLQEGKNGENPTFTVFENGNKVTYEITKDMYDALKPKNELLSKIDDNKVSKIANKVNNFRRGLLTEYNPVFSITNAIKDSQDILLNSQHSAKTYAKIPEATAQILSKGYWYNEYIQNGGSQNSYFKDGEFETTKNNLPTKIKNTITFPLRAISNVNNVIEMTSRLAEYIVSREQGRSIETSMLDAARVTTNFKAGGDITKTLNRNGFTFLNASVQGMQQQIRNIQEANAKGLKGYAVLACKYAIAGAPVLLLNNLLWTDDDEYEELQDYVKDNYYIIGKLPNGKFLRIPKGRAVATIQKIVSNVNDFIKNDSINSDEVGKIFWEDMKENIQFGIDNLAPNNPMENNILSPIFQAITNKTWYGDDLVPTRLQNKPKEEQYDETTDSFSRWLGEKTGISPIKINYLIDQYSGGAGDILLPLGTPQAENNVIEDKFTTDATMKSKYPGEFFSKVDELEINSNSSKATDEDILKYKYISSVSTEIGKLYTKKREIQNSSATDKEKKAQLKEVQEQINELAKDSLENVDKINKGENYAQIDTKQYYKDIEGEWKAVSKKDVEKNKKSELSLKTYSSYKYEMSKVKQEKVSKGQMTEEQSLKDNEQIQILLDSNYSDKDKTIIYEDYIKTSVKEGEYDSFKVIKASGININEYLKYEQQEFKSDKDEDGTLAGKTVSKSKQKKVVEYLNSMNIKGNQRLLLYAMQGYTTTSSQKTQLANYVNGLKIDKNTKLKLYDKFSGFTVYKDGTIKY